MIDLDPRPERRAKPTIDVFRAHQSLGGEHFRIIGFVRKPYADCRILLCRMLRGSRADTLFVWPVYERTRAFAKITEGMHDAKMKSPIGLEIVTFWNDRYAVGRLLEFTVLERTVESRKESA